MADTPTRQTNGAPHPMHRPFTITLLYVWAIISGVSNILGGIYLIVERFDPRLQLTTFRSSGELVAAGILAIVFGAIYIALGSALAHGSNFVRILFAVFASINVAIGFWAVIAWTPQRESGAFAMVFGLLALFLLFNRHAEEFFEASNPVE